MNDNKRTQDPQKRYWIVILVIVPIIIALIAIIPSFISKDNESTKTSFSLGPFKGEISVPKGNEGVFIVVDETQINSSGNQKTDIKVDNRKGTDSPIEKDNPAGNNSDTTEKPDEEAVR